MWKCCSTLSSFQMTKHNQRLIEGMRVMEFFFLRTWRWQETNSLQLLASLDSKDQEVMSWSFFFQTSQWLCLCRSSTSAVSHLLGTINSDLMSEEHECLSWKSLWKIIHLQDAHFTGFILHLIIFIWSLNFTGSKPSTNVLISFIFSSFYS